MKKLASILALTAVVANLGIAVVFAQDPPAPVTGTQSIGCETLLPAQMEFSNLPTDFSFGSRTIRNVNDINDGEVSNASWLAADPVGLLTETVAIESDTSFQCGHSSKAVTLEVSAAQFVDGGGAELRSFGLDNETDGALVGGLFPADDYGAALSISTGADLTCDVPGTCLLASGSTLSDGLTKGGLMNFFASPDLGSTALSLGDATALLINSTGALNTVTLFSVDLGYNGILTVPGVDYSLALPANVSATGVYTSEVTYTLS